MEEELDEIGEVGIAFNALYELVERLLGVLGHVSGVARQFHNAREVIWSRRPPSSENANEFILRILSREERPSRFHFCDDTADAPHVNGRGVVLIAKEHLRSTIPERNDFMRVIANRNGKGTCETKISKFEGISILSDEEILRFEVAMKDALVVTERDSLAQLIREGLDHLRGEDAMTGVKELLEVLLAILEDESEFFEVVNDLDQADEEREREGWKERMGKSVREEREEGG